MDDSESIETPQDEDTIEQIITTTSEDFDQDVVDPVYLEETGSQNSIENDDAEQATLEISLEPVAVIQTIN